MLFIYSTYGKLFVFFCFVCFFFVCIFFFSSLSNLGSPKQSASLSEAYQSCRELMVALIAEKDEESIRSRLVEWSFVVSGMTEKLEKWKQLISQPERFSKAEILKRVHQYAQNELQERDFRNYGEVVVEFDRIVTAVSEGDPMEKIRRLIKTFESKLKRIEVGKISGKLCQFPSWWITSGDNFGFNKSSPEQLLNSGDLNSVCLALLDFQLEERPAGKVKEFASMGSSVVSSRCLLQEEEEEERISNLPSSAMNEDEHVTNQSKFNED
jgi:hypothetical protein